MELDHCIKRGFKEKKTFTHRSKVKPFWLVVIMVMMVVVVANANEKRACDNVMSDVVPYFNVLLYVTIH